MRHRHSMRLAAAAVTALVLSLPVALSAPGPCMSTIAGERTSEPTLRFSGARALTSAPDGTLYFGDESAVYAVNRAASALRLVGGGSTTTLPQPWGAPPASLALAPVAGLAFDPVAPALYIAQPVHRRILALGFHTGMVTVLVGSGVVADEDGGEAVQVTVDAAGGAATPLTSPSALALDAAHGRLYFAEPASHCVRWVDLRGAGSSSSSGAAAAFPVALGACGVAAPFPYPPLGPAGLPASSFLLAAPSALALEPVTGALFVADEELSVVVGVAPSTGQAGLVAGVPHDVGSGLPPSGLAGVVGLALDPARGTLAAANAYARSVVELPAPLAALPGGPALCAALAAAGSAPPACNASAGGPSSSPPSWTYLLGEGVLSVDAPGGGSAVATPAVTVALGGEPAALHFADGAGGGALVLATGDNEAPLTALWRNGSLTSPVTPRLAAPSSTEPAAGGAASSTPAAALGNATAPRRPCAAFAPLRGAVTAVLAAPSDNDALYLGTGPECAVLQVSRDCGLTTSVGVRGECATGVAAPLAPNATAAATRLGYVRSLARDATRGLMFVLSRGFPSASSAWTSAPARGGGGAGEGAAPGALHVIELASSRIRLLAGGSGSHSTLPSGRVAPSGDGGPAAAASLHDAFTLALDDGSSGSSGSTPRLFILQGSGAAIRVLTYTAATPIVRLCVGAYAGAASDVGALLLPAPALGLPLPLGARLAPLALAWDAATSSLLAAAVTGPLVALSLPPDALVLDAATAPGSPVADARPFAGLAAGDAAWLDLRGPAVEGSRDAFLASPVGIVVVTSPPSSSSSRLLYVADHNGFLYAYHEGNATAEGKWYHVAGAPAEAVAVAGATNATAAAGGEDPRGVALYQHGLAALAADGHGGLLAASGAALLHVVHPLAGRATSTAAQLPPQALSTAVTPCPRGAVCACGRRPAPCTDAAAFCPGDATAPVPVPPGFRSLPVAEGEVLEGLGAGFAAAEACPPGFFCPGAAAGGGLALPCPAGAFGTQAGQSLPAPACHLCPPGTFQPVPGLGASSASSSSSPSLCAPCPPGSYAAAPGSPFCTPCPPGTAAPGSGANASAACVPCPPGAWSPPGASACLPLAPATDAVEASPSALFFHRGAPFDDGNAPFLASSLRVGIPILCVFALPLLVLLAARFAPPRLATPALALLRRVDTTGLSHPVPVGASPVRTPTSLGGGFTLLFLGAFLALASVLVQQYRLANTAVQQALLPLSFAEARALRPVAPFSLAAAAAAASGTHTPGLSTLAPVSSGFVLTLEAPGLPCAALAGPLSLTLASGAPRLASAYNATTQVATHTLFCEGECLASASSVLRLPLPSACSQARVTVAGVGAWGTLTASTLHVAALGAVELTFPLALEAVQDTISGSSSGSSGSGDGVWAGGRSTRGWVVSPGTLTARAPSSSSSSSSSSPSSSLEVVVNLRLAPSYTRVLLTPAQTPTQLVAAIFGLLSILGIAKLAIGLVSRGGSAAAASAGKAAETLLLNPALAAWAAATYAAPSAAAVAGAPSTSGVDDDSSSAAAPRYAAAPATVRRGLAAAVPSPAAPTVPLPRPRLRPVPLPATTALSTLPALPRARALLASSLPAPAATTTMALLSPPSRLAPRQ